MLKDALERLGTQGSRRSKEPLPHGHGDGDVTETEQSWSRDKNAIIILIKTINFY
jgi:hypothetical protein